MGHALDYTIQDLLIRYKRMCGYNALWVPGIDHSAIATEVKVVEKMKKEEGLTKADITREQFLERAWAWTKEYGGTIQKQQRRLTTRPETMLRDTAVAVHPDDERYKDIVGKTCILPIMNKEIPIIADEFVEKDFGTGCVNATPFDTQLSEILENREVA